MSDLGERITGSPGEGRPGKNTKKSVELHRRRECASELESSGIKLRESGKGEQEELGGEMVARRGGKGASV